jgi:hypothetical protein
MTTFEDWMITKQIKDDEQYDRTRQKLLNAPQLPEHFNSYEDIAEWCAEYSVWWKTRMTLP